jgi:hypothetical protein
MNEKHEVIEGLLTHGPEEELVPLMDEPYEEALKIVETTLRPNQK